MLLFKILDFLGRLRLRPNFPLNEILQCDQEVPAGSIAYTNVMSSHWFHESLANILLNGILCITHLSKTVLINKDWPTFLIFFFGGR